MGSGKTTVGRRVAKRLGRPFVDADTAIEDHAGRSVREVFATDGEAGFRKLEAEVLEELLSAAEPSVIAAGGGVVVTDTNRTRLQRADVFVVWLRASAAFLASRAKPKEHRPLLDDDPEATLIRLADERDGWYAEVADAVVEVEPAHRDEDKPKAHLADLIVELLP